MRQLSIRFSHDLIVLINQCLSGSLQTKYLSDTPENRSSLFRECADWILQNKQNIQDNACSLKLYASVKKQNFSAPITCRFNDKVFLEMMDITKNTGLNFSDLFSYSLQNFLTGKPIKPLSDESIRDHVIHDLQVAEYLQCELSR